MIDEDGFVKLKININYRTYLVVGQILTWIPEYEIHSAQAIEICKRARCNWTTGMPMFKDLHFSNDSLHPIYNDKNKKAFNKWFGLFGLLCVNFICCALT